MLGAVRIGKGDEHSIWELVSVREELLGTGLSGDSRERGKSRSLVSKGKRKKCIKTPTGLTEHNNKK